MSVKVMPYKHKGQDVFICTGSRYGLIAQYNKQSVKGQIPCGMVVENLNPTTSFPQGYHYDVCPKCKSDLDYTNPVIITPTKFNDTDYEVLARWAKEKFKS
jgi:hypothetical protein